MSVRGTWTSSVRDKVSVRDEGEAEVWEEEPKGGDRGLTVPE